MKQQHTQEATSIGGVSVEQVVRSIAHYQRKAAEIGLKPTEQEKDLLPVYRNLYESRKALLEAVKEGHPELWTDFLVRDHSGIRAEGSSEDKLTEAELMEEISRCQTRATQIAEADGFHEHNLRLAYKLMAAHRSHQLERLRQERNVGQVNSTQT